MRIVPALLREFRRLCPAVRIRLHERSGDLELLERVEDGRLDFAFTTLSDATRRFAARELLRDPYVLVVRNDSPLAAEPEPLPLSTLAGVELITLRNCSQQPLLDALLRAHSVEPKVVFSSDDNGVVQILVAAGVGSALVPRLTMDEALRLFCQPPPRR